MDEEDRVVVVFDTFHLDATHAYRIEPPIIFDVTWEDIDDECGYLVRPRNFDMDGSVIVSWYGGIKEDIAAYFRMRLRGGQHTREDREFANHLTDRMQEIVD